MVRERSMAGTVSINAIHMASPPIFFFERMAVKKSPISVFSPSDSFKKQADSPILIYAEIAYDTKHAMMYITVWRKPDPANSVGIIAVVIRQGVHQKSNALPNLFLLYFLYLRL